MKLSISKRLAAMFAVASFVMLSVLSVAMHGLLKRELERHQSNELQARWTMYRPIIMRNDDVEHWAYVRSKFDNSISENNRVSLWVQGADEHFRYGSTLTDQQQQSIGTHGFGQVMLPGSAITSLGSDCDPSTDCQARRADCRRDICRGVCRPTRWRRNFPSLLTLSTARCRGWRLRINSSKHSTLTWRMSCALRSAT